ncbi:MAG: eukaryotic-like serine/threonine-protein kinase [Verrucomicrobiota bacterium]
MSEKPSFFAELKRRNVYKVAVAYAVIAWLLIQAASILFPTFEAPTWVMKVFVVIVAAGFPIALVIAWAFEMTPEGMKRTEDVSPEEKIPQWSRRKFAALILVIAICAAALLGYQVFRTKPTITAASEPAGVPTKSIAVLPFENLSEDKANAYFADGIQDEILTRLSKIADLKVISRTSTQRFKSAPNDLREIAKQLGVANILEGSVQKSNEQVRITVQLINALNDSHLWAETYDRKMTDIFQVETDLAQKIAASLEAKLTGREKKEIAARGTTNPEAYDAFLHALALLNRQGVAALEESIKFLRRAVELDPTYAEAWCSLALAESQKYFYPDHSELQLARARTATETGIRLAPDSAEAAGALGAFNSYCLRDYDAALVQLEIARARAPNNANVLLGIGNVKRRKGLLDESIAVQHEAARLDPLNEDIWVNIGRGYRGLRRFGEARTMFDRAHAIAPSDQEVLSERAETYLAQGDLETSWKIVEPLKFGPGERGFGLQVVLLVFQRRFDDVEKLVAPAVADPGQSPLFRAIGRFALANLRVAKNDRAGAEPLFLQAETELNQLRAAGDDGVLLRDVLLGVEANLGHRDQVETIADSLLKTTQGDLWQFPREEETIARAWVTLGDFDRAIPLLEHALKVPAVEALTPAFLRLDPGWDPIRNDPRFQKLASGK